jgi:hypothetical protein
MNWMERFVVRRLVMSFLQKYWGTILAVGGPLLYKVLAFEEPSLNHYAAQHPGTLLAVIIGAMLTLYHSSAPKDKH